jgi:hypothetical protein
VKAYLKKVAFAYFIMRKKRPLINRDVFKGFGANYFTNFCSSVVSLPAGFI